MLSRYQSETTNESAFVRPNAVSLGTVAKNRGRIDIVADIVMSCQAGANKSRIMMSANVNSLVATHLIDRLISCGLIVARVNGDRAPYYHSTPEGIAFLRRYTELTGMLCPALVPHTRASDLNIIDPWA